MPINHIHQQQLDNITQNISTTQFKSASEELRRFMDEKGGALNGFYTLPDPHVVGFKVFFHFHDEVGLLANGDLRGSAEAYLNRIGETKRANVLSKFKLLLEEIQTEYSHQMTTLEGVGEGYTEGYGIIDREERASITIKFFETLDNKIQSLIGMYRHIVYDKNRDVWVLPMNMREFNISIYFFDAMFYTTTLNFLPTFENQDLLKINHTMLNYHKCTIGEKSGGAYFENITRGNAEPSMNNLIIEYNKSDVSYLFRNISGDTSINSQTISIATAVLTEELNLDNISVETGFIGNPNETRKVNELEIKYAKPDSLVE